MLHLWSLATWAVEITHDAGTPEWIDAPVTRVNIGDISRSESYRFDGERWIVRLPKTLNLLTAWYMDELCEHLYITCIDPRGITVHRILEELDVQEDITRLSTTGIPIAYLWYTVDGFYTFSFTYMYGGLPYQHIGSFRMMLTRKESKHE